MSRVHIGSARGAPNPGSSGCGHPTWASLMFGSARVADVADAEPTPHELGVGAAVDPPTGLSARPAAGAFCPCGHRASDHDRVAARYCQATSTGALHRGCVCLLALPQPFGPAAEGTGSRGSADLPG